MEKLSDKIRTPISIVNLKKMVIWDIKGLKEEIKEEISTRKGVPYFQGRIDAKLFNLKIDKLTEERLI